MKVHHMILFLILLKTTFLIASSESTTTTDDSSNENQFSEDELRRIKGYNVNIKIFKSLKDHFPGLSLDEYIPNKYTLEYNLNKFLQLKRLYPNATYIDLINLSSSDGDYIDSALILLENFKDAKLDQVIEKKYQDINIQTANQFTTMFPEATFNDFAQVYYDENKFSNTLKLKKLFPDLSINDLTKIAPLHKNISFAYKAKKKIPSITYDEIVTLVKNGISDYKRVIIKNVFPDIPIEQIINNNYKRINLYLAKKVKKAYPDLSFNDFSIICDDEDKLKFAIDLKNYFPEVNVTHVLTFVEKNLASSDTLSIKVLFPEVTLEDLLTQKYVKFDIDLVKTIKNKWPNIAIKYFKDKNIYWEDVIPYAGTAGNIKNAILFYKSGIPSYKIAKMLDESKMHTAKNIIDKFLSLANFGYTQNGRPEKSLNESNFEDIFKNSTEIIKLSQTYVVIANYSLLRRDFPSLRGKSNLEIDQWLLDHVGYIAKTQLKGTGIVNTIIPIDENFVLSESKKQKAYRPLGYGRALLFPIEEEHKTLKGAPKSILTGMLDAKGVGAKNPEQENHSNGLATLGESLREYIYQQLIQKVLDHAQVPYQTVECYAVIDAGFDIIHPNNDRSRAGIVVRQAHTRIHARNFIPQDTITLLEKLFAQYGIDVEGNIQGSKDNGKIFYNSKFRVKKQFRINELLGYGPEVYKIVDFGHYVVKDQETFDDRVDDSSDNFKKYYQDKIAVPSKTWGYKRKSSITPSERWLHAIDDNASVYSAQLAEQCTKVSHEECRKYAYEHMKTMLDEITYKLEQNPIDPQNTYLKVPRISKTIRQLYKDALAKEEFLPSAPPITSKELIEQRKKLTHFEKVKTED